MDQQQTGLSSEEAGRRLSQFGPNATPDVAVHLSRLVLGKFLAPVSVLLEIAIILQLVLGEYVEASIIALLLIFNAAIGFFHESRAQATVAALKSRLALNASALRDGAWTTLPAAELAPGDIAKLSLGTVVAADVHLLDGSVLLDQSMLTGESLPVEADPGAETYAGALVRRGEAVAEIISTGARTKFGRTAKVPFFESRASAPVIATSLIIGAVGIALPFSWFAGALGFVPLPPSYWVHLGLILLSYAVLTHLVKTWCTRRFGLS